LKAYRRDPARGRDGSDRATGLPQSVSEHCDIPSESCVELFCKDVNAIEGGGEERDVLLKLEGELEVVKRSSSVQTSYGCRDFIGRKTASQAEAPPQGHHGSNTNYIRSAMQISWTSSNLTV
jgi:hypothetical protein